MVKLAQKTALASNGVQNALPPGVPRLTIVDSTSSEKLEGSDELPTHVAPRYEDATGRTICTVLVFFT